MEWTIPGTILTARTEDAAGVDSQFRSMFLAGGMVLSQVSGLTGLEPYTIQNWVKRGFLSPPERKRYSLRQLCRIININMMKNVLPMERICGLMAYINGNLSDESDDIIDDSDLYFIFVRLASRVGDTLSSQQWDACIEQELSDYREPVEGARERVKQVLSIMLTAWASARFRQSSLQMMDQLEKQTSPLGKS